MNYRQKFFACLKSLANFSFFFKKTLLILFLFIVSFAAGSFYSVSTIAQTPTPVPVDPLCYSQCAAYKFVWQGDYCWDLFQQNCSKGSGNDIKDTIKFLKTVYDVMKGGAKGEGADTVFTAWFICKPLIENCIAPQLNECRTTCQMDQYFYAPNLSVGHPDSSFHGVYYDEKSKQLYFKLINSGRGYAWDIDVSASYGHTRNRDGKITGGQNLFSEKVEHLIYLGARNGPPKTLNDYVGDFLINEAQNGQYLQGFKKWLLDDFKSDADNYNVPNYWIKAIPFVPIQGELNRIIFNADPNKFITESNETNNTFIFDIDLRPTPARFTIENFSQKIIEQTLNDFMVSFRVKNTGEENGTAKVKIYEGNFQEGEAPIYQTEQVVIGEDVFNFDTIIKLDAKKETNPYCGRTKEYTIVVTDDDNNKTERKFSLPIYVGSVTGRVEDLFGKKVIGATIKASTGEETVTTEYGSYRLKGITTLGKVTITATHPEFSQPVSKEVVFKYVDEFKACDEGNLILSSVNFILKDQDVLFTVNIKDSAGNPVTANVLAVNSDWRFNETVNGTSPLPGMQPGKYQFIISAPGYKTISQDINAVPNNQHLEFTLEKLLGRPDDSSLRLITPKLLWKKTLGQGERITSQMSGSKNGNLLVAYAVDNKAKNSNLYFLEPISGRQVKEVSVPYALGYEGFVGLDTSYDGSIVGLNTNLGIKKDNERILKLFDAVGNEIGSTTLSKGEGGWVTLMDVSPDGFYLCTYDLIDKGLHRYTQYETEGKMDYTKGSEESAKCGFHFLRNNNYLDSCNEGLCEKTISNQQVRVFDKIDEGLDLTTNIFDSAFDDQTTVVRTYKKLYYFGGSNWSKELGSDNMYNNVAVSPGGMYAIVTGNYGDDGLLKLKIFGNTGGDKTPDFPYKNVKFVFANDKGLFFAQVVLNRIEFYQVGEYQTDYKPQTLATPTPESLTSGLYHFTNGRFDPAGDVRFENLLEGHIYMAGRNINFDMGGTNGTLHILNGTYFSVDQNHHPILLKGQLTAEFNSPNTVYAIKFDRFSMDLFKSKLGQFIAGTLSEDEYFIVKNIHTKFIINNNPNKITVIADSGNVQVLGKELKKEVIQGKQITIDSKNKVTETNYFGSKVYVIISMVFIFVAGVLLFLKRNTPVGKKIISLIKKFILILWNSIKSIMQFLISLLKKLIQKIKSPKKSI